MLLGGYLGYLSALVELDEQKFLQQVEEATDKARLEKQLARTKSILDARSRAYIRRSQEFIRQKQLQLSQEGIPSQPQEQERVIEEIHTTLSTIDPAPLEVQERQELQSLKEEQQDLTFFQDEVEV